MVNALKRTIDEKCVICSEQLNEKPQFFEYMHIFYDCPVCGKFVTYQQYVNEFNKDYLRIFLFYNKHNWPKKRGLYFISSCAVFDKWKQAHQEDYGSADLVTEEVIEAWYPKNFNEKINKILLKMEQLSTNEGYRINFSRKQIESLFFVKTYSKEREQGQTYYTDKDIVNQISFFENYLNAQKLTCFSTISNYGYLLSDGWKRVDELQKNQTHIKQVFVAISFAEEAIVIRERIEEGVRKAGYEPVVMDKHKHNNQIVPEMLRKIRESRFVVADLTFPNLNVYYESGYAFGLGKEVIHTAKKETFIEAKGTFDVKQKATVLWETDPQEIVDLLVEQIKSTIG
ncbi:MAG: hypothetical protein LBH62_09380 [Nitrososphaerota archaeon]|jgi:nucleoside 2-deoxyribosyltransferase|nr:hypothetical protein [Nitrososphaerota archaeon]